MYPFYKKGLIKITKEGWNPALLTETGILGRDLLKTLSWECFQMGLNLCSLHGETHQWCLRILLTLRWHSAQTSVLQVRGFWGLHCLPSQGMAMVASGKILNAPLSSLLHPLKAGVPSHREQEALGS